MVEALAPVALVIEDEPSIRAFVAEVLREAGFQTCEATDAPEAFAQLEAMSELALIVSDVRMPGYVDGAMFANVAAQYHPQVSIVVISGFAEPRAGQLPRGALFLQKPFTSAELLDAVAAATAVHQQVN